MNVNIFLAHTTHGQARGFTEMDVAPTVECEEKLLELYGERYRPGWGVINPYYHWRENGPTAVAWRWSRRLIQRVNRLEARLEELEESLKPEEEAQA
jgi:hypothetical protein